MEGPTDLFEHVQEYRILRCRRCRYAVAPQHVKAHVRDQHQTLSKAERAAIVSELQSVPDVAYEFGSVVHPVPGTGAVDGFPIYVDGLACRYRRDGISCTFVCRALKQMQKHCRERHGWRNGQRRGGNKQMQELHTPNRIWASGVSCQRFFREQKWLRYFEVDAPPASPASIGGHHALDFFVAQRKDVEQATIDASRTHGRVDGFGAHHSTVVPWLQTTGVVTHLEGLSKEEIRSAVALPDEEHEASLHAIVEALDTVLRRAHASCFDGKDRLLTWACRVALSRFQSAQVEGVGKTRAFEPNKQERSLKRYIDTMKRFLCYCGRVAFNPGGYFTQTDGELPRPEDSIELSAEQEQQWQRVSSLAVSLSNQDFTDESATGMLEDGIVLLLMSLIGQDVGARRYSSPLVSFCAMLAIKPSTGAWMEPGNFNSHLSAIIWVVQLMIYYRSAEQERAGEGRTIGFVKQYCNDYLQQTVETPMGELLRWRLLLFHVSKNTVSGHEAIWDEAEEVLTYRGQEFALDQIPTLVQIEFQDCQRLLYEDLLFGNAELRRMEASTLKDNDAVDIVGWNFCSHPENKALLGQAPMALLATIEASNRLRQLYTEKDEQSATRLRWRESALASYESTAQQFLERLCALWQILSGQPIREPEFLSITWQNTQRKRAISIQHRRVMVHTQYDKSQQITGDFKENIRFLPRSMGDMLLDFLVYVQPLRQTFLRHHRPGGLLSPFLWSRNNQVWPESKLSYCLEQASVRARTPRLTIHNWRQMTVAIVKTKFASDIGVFQEDKEDEDAEEMDVDIRAMTRQRNHKTRTVNRAYANRSGAQFAGVWDGLIRMGLRASTLWQDFWGADVILKTNKRKCSDEDSRLSKRIAVGVYRPKKAWSSDALLAGMRQLFKRPDMEWKTTEQCQALTLIMGWSEQVVAILPTGAGKSMLFMVPCGLPDAASTILVVPLVALRGDLLHRISLAGIELLEWLPGERREAPLIIVSVEAAATKDFMTYAQYLVSRQRLDRIVIDECHLTVTAAEYRESMVDLMQIRALRTQFVYLTATLPPSMWDEFVARNYLVQPRVIRASSHRSNIFYMVQKAVSGKGTLLQQAIEEVRVAWDDPNMVDQSRDKIILYTTTRTEAETLADMLDCDCYTSQSGTVAEKQAILERWTTDVRRPVLVATAALAEGFDYPHVRVVVHVAEPDSMILFAQESGRAGRDGRKAYSLVLLPTTWEATQRDTDIEPATSNLAHDRALRKAVERKAMQKYLKATQCFRLSLSEYLDIPAHRRWCMEDDYACDVCRKGHDEPSPRHKSEPSSTKQYTGLDEIQKRKLEDHLEMSVYVERLATVRGTCVYCRMLVRQWNHAFVACPYRMNVISARREALQRHAGRSRTWLQPYTACYLCLNPQSLCGRTQGEDRDRVGCCDHPDIVLPLCCGLFESVSGPRWLQEHFGREFESLAALFDWLGQETVFGGQRAIQGVRVAAAALACLDGPEPTAKASMAEPGDEWLF